MFYRLFIFVFSFTSLAIADTTPFQVNGIDYVTLPQGIVKPLSEVNFFNEPDWGRYPPKYYWGDTTLIDLKNKPLLFLTHHSSVYDEVGKAEKGANEVLDLFLNFQAPVFYLYSFRFAGAGTFRFLNYYNKFVGVESEGGENKLRYQNSRNFFFTGGHFSMCLCETIRDTVRNIVDLSMTETTHFYFVQEGIYDEGNNLKTWSDSYQKKNKPYSSLVNDRIIRNNSGRYICNQNWRNQPQFYIDDLTIEIQNADTTITTISNGNKGRLRFHLIGSNDVKKVLEEIAL